MSDSQKGTTAANAPATTGEQSGPASKLGFVAGQVIQEFGWDSDVDDDFRFAVEDITTTELEDEDYTGVADGVIMWWRDEDGDLTDALVDVLTPLAEGGCIALLTPKPGRAGEVDPSEVEEAAVTSGLHFSGTVNACPDWLATRLVAPKSARR
ncbi:DUF3052 domain-containing protein [Kribbia dieselivorans]|uniref:DUF3052 domain-containing protein n=1 Tax=Kribbia dieselivorans TaxID=331526 RepID=UPI0009F968CF|nr:DUF3052 domain-containing protein [Kribbia dieselivorans]